jgi:uncharacterized protein (UPF0276 family)
MFYALHYGNNNITSAPVMKLQRAKMLCRRRRHRRLSAHLLRRHQEQEASDLVPLAAR